MTVRVVVGFLVAPLIPALVFALLTPITATPAPDRLTSIIVLTPVAYLFAGTATVLLGVPIFLTLYRLALIRWWSAIAAGIAVGAVVALVVPEFAATALRGVVPKAALGGMSGLVFWLIWRPGHAA